MPSKLVDQLISGVLLVRALSSRRTVAGSRLLHASPSSSPCSDVGTRLLPFCKRHGVLAKRHLKRMVGCGQLKLLDTSLLSTSTLQENDETEVKMYTVNASQQIDSKEKDDVDALHEWQNERYQQYYANYFQHSCPTTAYQYNCLVGGGVDACFEEDGWWWTVEVG